MEVETLVASAAPGWSWRIWLSRVISGAMECEAVRSQWRISYFSLSRYSSLPGLASGVFSPSS